MRWRDQRESDNVEDRRGIRVGGPGIALGGGGIVLVIVALALLTGQDPLQLLASVSGPSASVGSPGRVGRWARRAISSGKFASTVLGSTEDVWGRQFCPVPAATYQPPTLVLFCGAVESACGFTSAAVGPFYCPRRRQGVSRPRRSSTSSEQRFGAPGDFAQAYVIAHEVGHHVQNLLGIADRVQTASASGPRLNARPTPCRCAWSCRPTVLRRLGVPRQPRHALARAGRRRGRAAARRQRHRRRPAAEAGAGIHRARDLDARLVRHARPLAAARPGRRRHQPLRHLRQLAPLINAYALAQSSTTGTPGFDALGLSEALVYRESVSSHPELVAG